MSHEIGDEKFMARLAAAVSPLDVQHWIAGHLVIEWCGLSRTSQVVAVLDYNEGSPRAAVVDVQSMAAIDAETIDALYGGATYLKFEPTIVPVNVVDGISWEQTLDEALSAAAWTTQWGVEAPTPPMGREDLEATIARLNAELDAAVQAGAALVAENRALLARAEEATRCAALDRAIALRGAGPAAPLIDTVLRWTDDGTVTDDEVFAAVREFRGGGSTRLHETAISIQTWQLSTFGPGTMLGYARRALEELQTELIPLLEANDMDVRAIAEIADVVILLSHIAASHGVEIASAVDAKMAINRARRWRMTGGGHGQHIEDGGAP